VVKSDGSIYFTDSAVRAFSPATPGMVRPAELVDGADSG
jgi:hypothetical protein